MRTTLSLTLACLLALVACSDDAAHDTPIADAASVGAPGTPSSTDAGTAATTDAAPPTTTKIPLLVWVDDLVDNHTRDDAAPDTVDDKNIADNEDPTAFDRRFQ